MRKPILLVLSLSLIALPVLAGITFAEERDVALWILRKKKLTPSKIARACKHIGGRGRALERRTRHASSGPDGLNKAPMNFEGCVYAHPRRLSLIVTGFFKAVNLVGSPML